MSAPTREQQPQRRSRIYGVHDVPAARCSVLSLASNVTATSTISSGSTSTVRQDPSQRPRHAADRRKKTRPRIDSEKKVSNDIAEAARNPGSTDVFQFLIEGKEREMDDTQVDAHELRQPETQMKHPLTTLVSKPEMNSHSDESDTEGFYRSRLSDSGISMGSSISEIQSEHYWKEPLPPLLEGANDSPRCLPSIMDQSMYAESLVGHSIQRLPVMESNYAPSIGDTFYHHDPHIWPHYPPKTYTPEPMPLSPASIRSHVYPLGHVYHSTPEPPSTEEQGVSCLDSTPLVFREKGSETLPQPNLFRSFARVNRRMLLQMQTNIADLEHELLLSDAKTLAREHSAKRRNGEHRDGSRRYVKDQARRADLYQELHMSLQQYHEALESYNRVTRLGVPAEPTDIALLRSWLDSHVTPSSRIPSLVGNGSDLIMVGPTPNMVSDQTLRVIAYSVLTNVFVPLLLFKVSSGTLSRLVLLSLTTCAGALVLDRHRTSTQVDFGGLHWHCILGCAGISFIVALIC